MRRLFVFRPEPAASRTVDKAKAMGLDVVSVPLFSLERVDWSAPDRDRFDAILLTSANAVNLAGEQLQKMRQLPVHAVGEATAVAARVAGLRVATVGTGGVDDLLAKVEPNVRLVHLCGEDRRIPSAPAQAINALTVYRAVAAEGCDLGELRSQVAVLHSPRAARRLRELVDETTRSTIHVAAISAPTAEVAGRGWAEVRIAASPNDSELLALAARLCET